MKLAESLPIDGVEFIPFEDAEDYVKENGPIPPDELPIAASKPAKTILPVWRMSDVEPEAVDWLWYPYLPRRKVSLLEGDPGIGKSWLTCAIAKAIAAGGGLPGMELLPPDNVLMLSAEDGLADTIRPRLDAMQADVSRIFAIDTPVCFDEIGIISVEEAIAEYKPSLVMVDPLVAYIGGQVDMHRANEVREVMARLALVASRQNVAILCVRHLNKGTQTKAIYRGQGSIDCEPSAKRRANKINVCGGLGLSGDLP